MSSGIVTATFGPMVEIAAQDGVTVSCAIAGSLRHALPSGTGLLPGDRVLFSPPVPGSAGRVTALLPRQSVLRRQPASRLEHRQRQEQALAANITLGLVVLAVREPAFRASVADRLLDLCRACLIAPVLLVNKAEGLPRPEIEALLDPYRRAGIEALGVSARMGMGLVSLRARCAGELCVLLGPSGVGKSALVRACTGDVRAVSGEVSAARLRRGRGRHTTAGARLYPLPGGGGIIDTAGIRALGLPQTDPLAAYPEMAALAASCRFTDCRHRAEPGCAVLEAVATGVLSRAAYDGWLRLQERGGAAARGRP